MVSTGNVHTPASSGVAKRQRKHAKPAAGNKIVMQFLVCEQCGERFAIEHLEHMQDVDLAQRQATWLAERFVWDHIQENHHAHTVELPSAAGLK